MSKSIQENSAYEVGFTEWLLTLQRELFNFEISHMPYGDIRQNLVSVNLTIQGLWGPSYRRKNITFSNARWSTSWRQHFPLKFALTKDILFSRNSPRAENNRFCPVCENVCTATTLGLGSGLLCRRILQLWPVKRGEGEGKWEEGEWEGAGEGGWGGGGGQEKVFE